MFQNNGEGFSIKHTFLQVLNLHLMFLFIKFERYLVLPEMDRKYVRHFKLTERESTVSNLSSNCILCSHLHWFALAIQLHLHLHHQHSILARKNNKYRLSSTQINACSISIEVNKLRLKLLYDCFCVVWSKTQYL